MLGVFFVILLGGLCFSRRSRDDDDGDNDEWEIYMSTQNGILFFFQLYISCAANRFFFSPTQEVIRVKIAYVGFVVVVAVGRGPCRGLGSSVLNRCLVVRKGIAEMVADASTHAVMYQVEGTRRYTTIRLPTNPNMFFYKFHRVFSDLLSSVTTSSFQHLLRAIRIRIFKIRRSILAPMENTSITSFLTRFCLKAKQKTKKKIHD